MSGVFIIPESERRERIAATAPGQDVWVSANAGSGKTTVLRNRVIRLLLAGVKPDRILCLTYTKAAAAEMQGRIFVELARWVQLDDAALAKVLAELSGGVDGVDENLLARARTLFAHAIETPGGLKIQTIHAFAERVLHLFPLEAGVPLNFEVVEAGDAKAMRLTARKAAIAIAVAQPASKLGLALGEIVSAVSSERFEKALDVALDELATLHLRDEAIVAGPEREARYRQLFGISPGETRDSLHAAFERARPGIAGLKTEIDAVLALGVPGKSDGKALERLRRALAARQAGRDWVPAYLRVFLTEADEPRANAFTKGLKDKLPQLGVFEEDEKAACHAFIERRRALTSYHRSLAMLAFAEDVLGRFEVAKRTRALLDFSDLIAALRRLLSRDSVNWIMMKLDSAIEHVLIDEAQDTTREMWDIVKALTGEFFAGEGRTRRFRSLFVVGDEKQSIFSFQGADPAVFDDTRLDFAAKSVGRAGPDADRSLNRIHNPVPLRSSFRSSADVLAAVDKVFATAARAEGLGVPGAPTEHHAAKARHPGLVELWPIDYTDPKAGGPAAKGLFRLAERIGGTVAELLENGRHFSGDEAVRPGDILILVQKRGPLFHAVLKALKQRGVPVSGADRLKLQQELVIRDLLVIAEAALTPTDDLALATALKTPLFGLDEAALERLARGRTGSLFDALSANPDFAPLAGIWRDLSRRARETSPFAFFAGLLNAPAPYDSRISGRKAIYQRLGNDAGEPLDAFLLEAQGFTSREPGSTLRFVLAQRARESELKRDLEQGTNKVRVMTVHGAKGLEARIVFLADATGKPDPRKEKSSFLVDVPIAGHRTGPLLVWSGEKDSETGNQRAARTGHRARTMQEYRRLLYVGMTRAADRLYVGGYSGSAPPARSPATPAPLEENWHQLVAAGLAEGGARAVLQEDGREVLRYGAEPQSLPAGHIRQDAAENEAPLPAWLFSMAPPPETLLPPLRPSDGFPLGDPRREEADEAGFGPRQRGILQHRLYEILPDVPAEEREARARMMTRRLAPGVADEDIAALVRPVFVALDQPETAWIFGRASRSEVSVAGTLTLPCGRRQMISGRIDRLVVAEGGIDIIDIKTGRERPLAETPAILQQLALYKALMSELYPDFLVRCHVFWGGSARLETVPAALTRQILETVDVNQV